MQKYFLAALVCLLAAFPAFADVKKEVVIFSQPCRFCDKMKEALKGGIIAANPDIEFTILDIREEKNDKLLRQFAQEHDLSGNIGLPLLFIGDNYMMGWGKDAKEELQSYIEEYKKENTSRLPVKLMLERE